MSNRRFPVASAFLEMQERRRQYRKHIDALRSCKHMVDDSQPIPPSYLVNRRTRQIELQRYIMQTGEENINLIKRYNQTRNQNIKNLTHPRSQNSKPNWVSEMYNSMAISRKAYSSFDQRKEKDSQKLPPLNSTVENKDTPEEEPVVINNSINENLNNLVNNDQFEAVSKDQNKEEKQDQIENISEDQNENVKRDKDEEQDQNENIIQNENGKQDTNEIQGTDEKQSENGKQDTNEIQGTDEKQDKDDMHDQDKDEKQDLINDNNDNVKKDNEKTTNTTLGGEGEKGRLDEMLDVLNGITE